MSGTLKDDLARLASRPAVDNRLTAAGTPPAKRAQTGIERKQTGKVAGDTVTAQSTDGLLTFVVTVVKV